MRAPLPLALLAPLVLLATACRPPDPAPDELSELLRFSFAHYPIDDPTHAVSLADAAVNLQAWFEAEAAAAEEFDPAVGYDASLVEDGDRLTDEELAVLAPPPDVLDGAAAAGVVVALRTSCTVEDIDRFYLRDDQDTLFPDSYLSYGRRDQQYDCYRDGDCEEATWTSEISQNLVLNVTSQFELRNRLRRVEAEAPDGTTVRARLVQAWMPAEAVLDPDDLGRWLQNYQLEFMIEDPSGGVLHVYPQWVHAEFGAINTEASAFLNGYIDGLREYVQILDGHCADG